MDEEAYLSGETAPGREWILLCYHRPINVGDKLIINPNNYSQEICTVSSVEGAVVRINSPLIFFHYKTEKVQVKRYETLVVVQSNKPIKMIYPPDHQEAPKIINYRVNFGEDNLIVGNSNVRPKVYPRKLPVEYKQVLLTEGEIFTIEKLWHPIIDDWSPIYKDMLLPFNFNKFTCPRLPIDMGKINKDALAQCPNVLRVPIKWTGSEEIRLPEQLLPIKEELIRIFQYEKFINEKHYLSFFAHITIDKNIIDKGKTHRYGGFHGDGLQGGKFKQKVICEHSYIFTDPDATHIALQPFFVSHIDENKYNIFKEFDKQVKKQNVYKLRDGHLYLIDPYVVHASPEMEMLTPRTFFRLTFSPEELLTNHNTVNPMFEGQKYPNTIEVREFVSDPDVNIPFDYYGIEKL